MRKKFSVFLHASAVSVMAAALLIGGCSRVPGTSASTEESTQAPESQETPDPSGESGSEAPGIPELSGTDTGSEETVFLHPVVEEHLSSIYSEDGSTLLCRGSSASVSLREDGYESLKNALSGYSSQREAALNRETEALREAAEEQLAAFPDEFRPYEVKDSVSICRADQQVFSFKQVISSNTGGAHSNAGVIGYTFDSQTGEQLTLEDVATDPDRLCEYLIGFLKNDERHAQLFEGWEETVRRNVFGETADGFPCTLRWTLTADGMNVYFDPYEIGPWSMGTITVPVPCDEEQAGISSRWAPMQEGTVWQLEPSQDLSLDINGDGKEETIRYSQQQAEATETVCTLSVNEQAVEMACGYGITRGYLMKNTEGAFYFYADCRSDNDYHFLNIVDISRLEQNGSGTEPAVSHMAFYDDVPVDSSSFWLSCPGTLFSTFPVRKEFFIGNDGMPETRQTEFTVSRWRIVTLQDVNAYTGTSFQEKAVIPEGTELFVTATDEASCVTAEVDDGTVYRILLDGTQWPRTIDGTDIQQLFEGLFFAG